MQASSGRERGPLTLLGQYALIGALATASATAAVAVGAIVASWMVQNLDSAKTHPRIFAIGTTVLAGVAVFRAVPWRRLAQWARARTDDADDDLIGSTSTGADGEPTDAPVLDRLGAPAWVAVILAAALLTTVIMYRHVLGHFATQMHGQAGDRDWYVFVGWKIGTLLRHGSSPFHLTGITAPYGYNMLVGDGFLPPMVLGLVNVVVRPIAAYNLMLMMSTVLSFVAGVHVASRLSASRLVQLVAGAALATTPVVFLRLQGHFSLCFTFPIALVLAEALVIARPAGHIRPVRLALWLFLAFGSTIYFLLVALGILVCALGARLWSERSALRPLAPKLGVAIGILLVLMSPFLVQRTRLTNAEIDAGSTMAQVLRTDGELYNADVMSEALPTYPSSIEWPGSDTFARHIVVNSGEGNLSFPGLALITVGVGGLVASRRPRLVAVLAALSVLWLLSLGPVADVFGSATVTVAGSSVRPHWLPFELIGHLPLFSALRAPGRLSLGIPCLLVVGLAFALDEVTKRAERTSAPRWVVAAPMVIVILSLVPNIPTLRPQPAAAATAPARSLFASLRSRPGNPGRVVPVPSCIGSLTGVESSLQIWHHLDVVGCEGPYLALPFASKMHDYEDSGDLAALRCTPSVLGYVNTRFAADFRTLSPDLGELRADFAVRYLVVDATAVPACPGLENLIRDLGTRYTVLPGDQRWSVIDLDSKPGGTP